MTHVRPARWLPAVLLLVLPSVASAQVVYPAVPEKLAVEFRYRITADRTERVRQFRAMEATLKDAGFVRDTTGELEPELDVFDPTAERMRGTLPATGFAKLQGDPRIKTILFRPADFAVPGPEQRVAVRLALATGFTPGQQQRFHGQTVAHLARIGFTELVGYDPQGFTIVRGDLPAGNLFRLVKDVRNEPSGWFAADAAEVELPVPLRDVNPVRLVQVLNVADPAPYAAPPVAPNRAAFTPDLRAVLDNMAAAGQPLRVEVVTDRVFDTGDIDRLRTKLMTEYSRVLPNPTTKRPELAPATVEGSVGHVLTLRFVVASDLERFAAEPGVVYVRLPRAATETAAPAPAGAPAATAPDAALRATKLDAFHKNGFLGDGTKVIVIATDFPGMKATPGVTLLDLTAELSPDVEPAPSADATESAGTAAARAARLAAPKAALVLVRVDPASLFQVVTVARFARGDATFSDAMQSRIVELTLRTEELKKRNTEAVLEYRTATANNSDDDRAVARRDAATKALNDLIAEEAATSKAIARATALQRSMEALAGATVVVNTLAWDAGFPMDGLSALSQYVDTGYAGDAVAEPISRSATRPRLSPRPVWVQAASPAVGSVWGGPFVDADGNAHAEFAPPGVPLPKGEWTRELNFLASRAADGTVTPTLKAGTKLRLTVQWRETHDSAGYGGTAAVFPLTVRVFQQLDPAGKVRASDELKEVARPVGGPYRLVAEPTYGIYEQVVEFAVPEDGRYAVMLDGQELYDARLPALRRHLQVNPRVLAEFVGAPGRPVFASFAPPAGGVGMPADSRSAVTVAATGGPQLIGAGPGVALLVKPDLFADGTVGGAVRGNAVAAGFVGGGLAAMVGSGAAPTDLLRTVGLPRGGLYVVPEGWLRFRSSR
ncbi:hypothetical protein [Urbifossiella limnaea]|uniref:Uncharacterized protein n=1 Tax=Urbifossiella limnaea TaxID=2528023 RepID=A0A517XR57_9BACT|nr:hypothetical protein [Urbifossiella limnaea]QDU19979.1 hypothetical protein ETAA1_19210 [Urbifossiella limnaea]